jgi:hypothetical protein
LPSSTPAGYVEQTLCIDGKTITWLTGSSCSTGRDKSSVTVLVKP